MVSLPNTVRIVQHKKEFAMSRLTVAQKHARYAQFLVGLSRPNIMSRMAKVGFTPQLWEKAWSLIRHAVDSRLGTAPTPENKLGAVADLERLWFPIVQTTLEMNYPALHAELLGNYARVDGPALIPLVEEVVARIESLETSPDPVRNAARALLAERGITAQVLAEIKEAVAAFLVLDKGAPAAEKIVADADDAMWTFYLEWSRIARSVITDRLSLRQLGFLRSKRGEEETPAAPPVMGPGQVPAYPALPAKPVQPTS